MLTSVYKSVLSGYTAQENAALATILVDVFRGWMANEGITGREMERETGGQRKKEDETKSEDRRGSCNRNGKKRENGKMKGEV